MRVTENLESVEGVARSRVMKSMFVRGSSGRFSELKMTASVTLEFWIPVG